MTEQEREELIRKMQQEILRTMAKRNCIIAGIVYNENSNNVDEFDICEALDHARAALAVAEPVIREECARIAEVAAKRDLAYADKYPDEAQKMEDRAHRAKTIAAVIREGGNEE